jgi:hypothetical protein
VRFRFDPAGKRGGGIRLIEEIPDYRICHLEGRNGAGKSLALRLLELITGEQPYRATPSAWSSLRENLGNTTITIDGLDAQTLRVELRPERWRPTPEPVGEWLGDAFLNAKPIEITSISSILRVVRIAGNETFEKTIQQWLEAERENIRQVHDRWEKQFYKFEFHLEELARATSVVDPERRYQRRLESVTVQVKEAEHAMETLQQRIALLSDAVLANQRLTAVSAELPAVQEQLARHDNEEKETEDRLRSAQERQAVLLENLAQGSEVEDQMEKARQLRDARLRRLKKLASQVQLKAAQLNVSATLSDITAATSEATLKRDQVQSERSSADHNASVRQFTSRVIHDLNSHRELDPEIVAVLDFEPKALSLSARQLRDGIQRRQIELTEIEDDPLRRELNKRVDQLSRRLVELGEFAQLITKRDRARALLDDSENDLAALVEHAQIAGDLRSKYEALDAEIRMLEQQLREVIGQQVRLRVQIDQLSAGKSREELAQDLKIALQKLDLTDISGLNEDLEITRHSAEEQRTRLRELRTEQSDLDRSLALQAAEIGQASASLAAIAWLPISVRHLLSQETQSQSGEGLLAMRKAVEAVRRSLYALRERFDQLLFSAGQLASEVVRRDRVKDTNKTVLQAELEEEMSERLREEFGQEEIQSALFDGGQLQAIDLGTLEARWVTIDGEVRSRPLEAFSSGEQVFAYTRARIQAIEAIKVKNKVVALDEFGAFLERDRLERLARFLRDAVGGSIAEQVIIVVPLAASYKMQAAVTSGKLGERFSQRAVEIDRRGYFAEDATERELV